MVVFCEATATFNSVDLHHLGEFVTSIRPAAGDSEAAVRLYNLCSAFYDVARVYFADSTAAAEGSSSDVAPQIPHTLAGPQEGAGNVTPGPGGVLQGFPLPSGNSFLGQPLENDGYMTWPPDDWFLPDQGMMGILNPGFRTS